MLSLAIQCVVIDIVVKVEAHRQLTQKQFVSSRRARQVPTEIARGASIEPVAQAQSRLPPT